MYKIYAKSEDTCEIFLYNLIEDGWTANRMISQLMAKPNVKHITLRINSEGGDIFESLAVYNYLKSREADVTVYIDGLAASAASIVACAGKVIMPENTMMIIHNAWSQVIDTPDGMREWADVMDKVCAAMQNVYTTKTGRSPEEIKALMDKETWLTAKEAHELGLCDEVIAAVPKQPDSRKGWDLAEHIDVNAAVKAERQRLRELDDIMTPERKALIMKAKYETLQNAQDIALELLRAQGRHEDYAETAGITPDSKMSDNHDTVQGMAAVINRKRGYSDGR